MNKIKIPASVAMLAGISIPANEKTFSDLPDFFKKNKLQVFARYKNAKERQWRYIVKNKCGWQGGFLTDTSNFHDDHIIERKGKTHFEEDSVAFNYNEGLKTPKAALKRATKFMGKPVIEYYSE